MSRGNETREKLLSAAVELIWATSYGAVSVDDICERANVKKGSFYHFFPSKADLVVAAYEECWRHSQPVLDAIFSPLVPPLERFSKWCAFAYEKGKAQFEAHGHVCGCPYASLGSEVGTQDEKLRAKSQELVEKSVRYVESALTDAKSRGLVQIANPASAAKAVYSCAMGIVLRAKLENDPEILRELEPSILQMIGAQTVAA